MSAARFVPHVFHCNSKEPSPFPGESAAAEPAPPDVQQLLEIVAQLAWAVDAQKNRIDVLERLAGPRRVRREHQILIAEKLGECFAQIGGGGER